MTTSWSAWRRQSSGGGGGADPKQAKLITTDGVNTHVTPTPLFGLSLKDIRLLLRAPFGSSKVQPEDLILFWVLKNDREFGY